MHNIISQGFSILLFWIFTGVCAFMATRVHSLHVLVVCHYIPGTIRPTPEYQIFGKRYYPRLFILFILITLFQFIIFIESVHRVLGFSPSLAFAVILTPGAVAAVLGFAFGTCANANSYIKIQASAKRVYERGFIGAADFLTIADHESRDMLSAQRYLRTKGLKRYRLLN